MALKLQAHVKAPRSKDLDHTRGRFPIAYRACGDDRLGAAPAKKKAARGGAELVSSSLSASASNPTAGMVNLGAEVTVMTPFGPPWPIEGLSISQSFPEQQRY